MAIPIAIFSTAGGTGKTTTAINLCAAFTHKGKRVLLIDMDPYAIATSILGIEVASGRTLFDVLDGGATIKQVVVQQGNDFAFSVVPAKYSLQENYSLAVRYRREYLLKEVMVGSEADFDYIIIDCSSSFNLLTINALSYARLVISPCKPEVIGAHSINRLTRVIRSIRGNTNAAISVMALLLTHYDGRKSLHRRVLNDYGDMREQFFSTKIRYDLALAEAPWYSSTVLDIKPRAIGAGDYLSLADEVLRKVENTHG